jgi:N-glycosylase/DNA lyase
MTGRSPRYRHLDELRQSHRSRRHALQDRLTEFAHRDPADYFYELVYCLLTPQSAALRAGHVVEVLRTLPADCPVEEIATVLRNKSTYVRFHNTKAARIVEARADFPAIAARLAQGGSPPALREWLVQNVKGLGWKEASHFLRNIGCRNLAILDRHILKNLKHHGVLASLPRTLTRGRYLAVERSFAGFADAVGIPMDELDLLFWSRETGVLLK